MLSFYLLPPSLEFTLLPTYKILLVDIIHLYILIQEIPKSYSYQFKYVAKAYQCQQLYSLFVACSFHKIYYTDKSNLDSFLVGRRTKSKILKVFLWKEIKITFFAFESLWAASPLPSAFHTFSHLFSSLLPLISFLTFPLPPSSPA